MLDTKQVRVRLRAIGRALRPLEREAERLAEELNDELIRLDDLDPVDALPEETEHPFDVGQYCEMDSIGGVADLALCNIQEVREEIALALRPKPRDKGRKAEQTR